MAWTKDDLQQLVKSKLEDYLFVVVSNREPYIHISTNEGIKCLIPASGLTVALDPIMRTSHGTWIAHGSGDADKQVVDIHNRVMVPPEDPSYTLRRVWLTNEEEQGYYYGFSNEALWPLCHIVYTRPLFDEGNWNTYKHVNQLFADAILDEIDGRKAFVFIQDYHLSLLSQLIKKENPNVITAQFWHIPWPNREAFRICPWHEEILHGLLGNDLLGFHLRYHCNNFLDTVDRLIEAKVDWERYEVTCGGKKTAVRPFPISADFEKISEAAIQKEVTAEIDVIRNQWKIKNEIIGIGTDRIDYTKGIPDRLKALDKLFLNYPEYKNNLVFFQLSAPSRTDIQRYRELNAEIDSLVEDINERHKSGDWIPIIHIKGHQSHHQLLAFNRLANFCIVSSLHDGMNLVAKEFVSSRTDNDGVLILSRFTGAARELEEALLINPYDLGDITEAIRSAIEMPKEMRKKRMKKMRKKVEENNIYKWAGDIISELTSLGSA